ncbi:hypothetical protein ACLB2K_045036 [Fragaria x ananassa]
MLKLTDGFHNRFPSKISSPYSKLWHARVSDFITPRVGWNIEKVMTSLLSFEADMILSISLPKQGDGALDVKREIYGIGAVHHDENGICLGVLVVSGTGLLSLHVVEALALVHGLHFCAQIGFTHLEVEGDTLNVFAGLDEAIDDFSEVDSKDSKVSIIATSGAASEFDSISFVHAFREADSCLVLLQISGTVFILRESG